MTASHAFHRAFQRRLRHLSEILVRNLDVSALYERRASAAPKPARNRLSWIEDRAENTSSGSRRPRAISRTSRDDIDLHLPPALQRRNSARRKRALSNLAWSAESNGSPPVAVSSLDKGKGKARQIVEEEALEEVDEDRDAQDPDESEVVFGWMSASTPTLTRSKSRTSVKSTSSRRSSSSFGKRLLRHAGAGGTKHNLRDSDADEEDDPESRSSKPPLSPSISHAHVSFQLSDAPPTFPASLSVNPLGGRNRSASRGSILSIASGSSGSTIRQNLMPSRPLPHDDRKIREKRRGLLRNHLVKSRITLSLPKEDGPVSLPASTNGSPVKPILSRSRTISLPLSPAHQSSLKDSFSMKSQERTEPFLVSSEHASSMDPSFTVDAIDFRVSEERMARLQSYERTIVGLWVQNNATATSSDMRSSKSAWTLHSEVEVAFRDLISLGSDVRIPLWLSTMVLTSFTPASALSRSFAPKHSDIPVFQHR